MVKLYPIRKEIVEKRKYCECTHVEPAHGSNKLECSICECPKFELVEGNIVDGFGKAEIKGKNNG